MAIQFCGNGETSVPIGVAHANVSDFVRTPARVYGHELSFGQPSVVSSQAKRGFGLG